MGLVVRRVQGVLNQGIPSGIPLGLRPVVGVDEGLTLLALKRNQPEGATRRGVGVEQQVGTRGGLGVDLDVAGNVETAGKRGLHGL